MELKRFKIQLDIKRKIYNEVFQVVQGDYDSNVIEIELLNDDEKYDLTGLNVEIAFRKADGTTVVQTINSGVTIVSAINGKIECILRTNTIAAIGKVTAEVRVLGTDNKLLTSTTFDFIVREAIVSDDTIESTNEFPVLTGLIETVNGLIDDVSLIEQQVPENVVASIGNLASLTTTEKSNLVGSINEVNADLVAHKADMTTDADGAHGLKVEYGTFTPVLRGQTVAGVHTYTAQTGVYYKIGRSVYIIIDVFLSSKDALMSGAIQIIGLPFAQAVGAQHVAKFNAEYSNVNFDTNPVGLFSGISGSAIIFYRPVNNGWAVTLNEGNINSNTRIMLSGAYITN